MSEARTRLADPKGRLTAPAFTALKGVRRITMATAYDAAFARMFDDAGIDALLVGDSLGMVVQGKDSTLSVTLDEMIYHCQAVARGSRRCHLVADMPFMSYQVSESEALRNAGRLISEGHAQAIKLEGGRRSAPAIMRIVQAGIPVMAHLGLTPQSVHAMGGFKVQGKADAQAAELLEDALAVCDAGAYAIVLEGIPLELAANITAAARVPTIGIGAGPHCDGQVLVCYDLLGLTAEAAPRFVKNYTNFFEIGRQATENFVQEVREGVFPDRQHSYSVSAQRPQPAATRRKYDFDA